MVEGGFVTAVSMRSIPLTINVAVTDWAAFIVTTQLPVPVHPAPLQPVNTEPPAGVAVNVTEVPLANDAVHVAPQLIPAGLLVTVPPLLPVLVTVRVYNCVKLAFTDLAALMVTVQVVPETVSHPLQPVKMEVRAGVAVSVTTVALT